MVADATESDYAKASLSYMKFICGFSKESKGEKVAPSRKCAS